MTDEMMALRGLVEKSSAIPPPGRPSATATASGTGKPVRGPSSCALPRLRKGSCLPAFLEPRRMAEKALTAVIQEAYVQGISTRSVDDLVKAMGMTAEQKT